MPDADSLIHPMSRTINDLVVHLDGYTRDTMAEWAVIREHFKRERERRGLTQKEIAIAGRIDQGAISKMESDERYMPSAMTFLGAVHGLGYAKLSEFFAEIEQLKTAPTDDKKHVVVAHHAPPEGSSISAAAASGPEVVGRFIESLQKFLTQWQEFQRAENTRPSAPARRSRRPARVARRR